jgi:prepilin-type N-terminal cleavage/methylation domain-containing protein
MRYPVRTKTRAGFTLIELLVVIAIIAILVGLVTAGVLKYMDTIPQTQTVNDIRQLQVAIESFKAKYGVYPPSSIFLSNSPSDYPAGSPHLAYLYAIWPRLNWNSNPPIDWSGGQGGIPAGGITLEGDQCLVFFLNGPGGIKSNGDMIANGWSTNPTNPTQAGLPRVGPFFEFPQGRLVSIAHPKSNPPQSANLSFPSFMDPYGSASGSTLVRGNVYAFFCSGRSAGGYGVHCPSLGVNPYIQANGRFYNNNTFQIISAGKNLAFGPGATQLANGSWTNPWPPGTPASAYQVGGSGVDDLSNFSGDILGVF